MSLLRITAVLVAVSMFVTVVESTGVYVVVAAKV
jgi:hypothetical protein